jgi:hypothetical protein
MVLVGWLLVGAFVVSSIGSGTAYRTGGYTGQFWALPLDDKLDHLHTHRRQWWLLSIGQLVGLIVMTAGVAGFTFLLADAGEGALAWVGFGTYLVALIAWAIGLIAQTATLPTAATQRAETGATPSWIHAFWASGYLAEATWVIVANIAYAVLGLAILQSGLLADWAGWVAIGLGIGIPILVVATRYGFPEMTQIVPLIVGIALILA